LFPQMSVFMANGIAILLSKVGQIAIKIIANQMQFSKLFEKKSTKKFIL